MVMNPMVQCQNHLKSKSSFPNLSYPSLGPSASPPPPFCGGLSVGQIAIDTANDLCNEGAQGGDEEKHHHKGFLITFKKVAYLNIFRVADLNQRL